MLWSRLVSLWLIHNVFYPSVSVFGCFYEITLSLCTHLQLMYAYLYAMHVHARGIIPSRRRHATAGSWPASELSRDVNRLVTLFPRVALCSTEPCSNVVASIPKWRTYREGSTIRPPAFTNYHQASAWVFTPLACPTSTRFGILL